MKCHTQLPKVITYRHRKVQSSLLLFVLGGRSTISPMNASTSSSTSASEGVLPHDPFTESTVTEIVSLGFTRAQVLAELRRLNGDKAQATAALFAKSLKF